MVSYFPSLSSEHMRSWGLSSSLVEMMPSSSVSCFSPLESAPVTELASSPTKRHPSSAALVFSTVASTLGAWSTRHIWVLVGIGNGRRRSWIVALPNPPVGTCYRKMMGSFQRSDLREKLGFKSRIAVWVDLCVKEGRMEDSKIFCSVSSRSKHWRSHFYHALALLFRPSAVTNLINGSKIRSCDKSFESCESCLKSKSQALPYTKSTSIYKSPLELVL